MLVALVGRELLSTALAVCALLIIVANVGSTGEPDGDTPAAVDVGEFGLFLVAKIAIIPPATRSNTIATMPIIRPTLGP